MNHSRPSLEFTVSHTGSHTHTHTQLIGVIDPMFHRLLKHTKSLIQWTKYTMQGRDVVHINEGASIFIAHVRNYIIVTKLARHYSSMCRSALFLAFNELTI